MPPSSIRFTTALHRKHPHRPVCIVVPHAQAASLGLQQSTAMVEGSVNGHPIGRRSIKRWDGNDGSPWFVEFTAPFCRQAGIAEGDTQQVTLQLADAALPVELEQLLAASPALRAASNTLSDCARRSSAEHVHAAQSIAARRPR